MPLPSATAPCGALALALGFAVFDCWAWWVVEPWGAKTVEDGGRQNSSNTSARREEWRWRYVAEESRDIVARR